MPEPIDSYTIKILWENNPDTPISSSSLSRTVDTVASYLPYDFIDAPQGGGTILTCDTVGDSASSVPANVRLIIKRGTVISIVNESENSLKQKIIPINDRYRVFDLGLQDLYITLSDKDQYSGNPSASKKWGENKEWFVYVCDKDDNSAYNKDDASDYGGGAEILVSLRRLDSNGNVLLYPDAYVPGRPTDKFSAFDSRLIGGFKSDEYGLIIEDSVWDIAGKHREVKASQYSIIDEFGIQYDDVDANSNLLSRHLYRALRPADLDTGSTSHNNVFENTVTINGDFIIGGVDPRLGPNLGTSFNSKSTKAEIKLSSGFFLETPQILFNANTTSKIENDFTSATIDGFTFIGNLQQKVGNIVFNDGSTTASRNYSFTVRSRDDTLAFHVDPNNTVGLGIEDPTARLDIKDNGPVWVDDWNKGIRLRSNSALMFGGDTDFTSSSSSKFYAISSRDNKLHFWDTSVSMGNAEDSHYWLTVSDRNLGVGTTTPLARIHEVTNSINGSTIDDNMILEDTRTSKGSNIVLKDLVNEWELGTQSAISGSDKAGFFIYNRNYSTDSTKRRNYIFVTPTGYIGSGTQDPDVDLQLEKEKNSDLWMKFLNSSTGASARTGISFHNQDIDTAKFELGLGGIGFNTTYSTWQDSAFVHTESDISGGLKVEIETGGIKISTSDKEKYDVVITDPSTASKGAFVGLNMNPHLSSDSTYQTNSGSPDYMLDVRSTETGDVTIAQFKTDMRGSTSANIKIGGARSDLQWPNSISSVDFDNFLSTTSAKYTMARIYAGSGIDSTVGQKGGLVFSTNDGSALTPRMYITSTGKVGIGQSSSSVESGHTYYADPDYLLDVKGDIGFDEYLHHNDDVDTYLRFKDNDVQIKAGDEQILWFNDTTSVISIGNTEYTLAKDLALDIDINSMMYFDASQHQIIVGNEMPSKIVPTADFDIAFSTAPTLYVRTTGTDKLAQIKIKGARTAITNDISALVFENVSVESAKISTKLEDTTTSKSNLIFSTNNGTSDIEAARINSDGDLTLGFGTSAGPSTAKLSVNGGVHIGGYADPGDNNLIVDSNITADTLTITNGTTFNDVITINTKQATGEHIKLNVASTPKYSAIRYYGLTGSTNDATIYYLDKTYTSSNQYVAGQFDLDSPYGATINSVNSTGTFRVMIGDSVNPQLNLSNSLLTVYKAATFNSSKDAAGNFTIKSNSSDNLFYTNASVNRISINSTSSMAGYELSIYNNLYTEGNIYNKGSLTVGGKDPTAISPYKAWVEGSLKVSNGDISVDRNSTFNASSGTYSFIVNGNGKSNIIYIPTTATTERIGIGTNSLQSGYLMTVAGSIYDTGSIYATASGYFGTTLTTVGASDLRSTVNVGSTLTVGSTHYQNGDILFDSTSGADSRIIKFNSSANFSSDVGYILWQSNSAQETAGAGTEHGRLTVGVGNDSSSASGDELWLQGANRIVQNVGTADTEINTILGSSEQPTSKSASDVAYDWRANNSSVANLNSSGVLTVNSAVQIGNSSTKLSKGTSNALRIDTSSGYLEIGPQNAGYCHYNTGATSGHWFGQQVTLANNLVFYNTSYGFTLAGAITGSSLNVGTGSITSGAIGSSSTITASSTISASSSVIIGGSGGTGAGTPSVSGGSVAVKDESSGNVWNLHFHGDRIRAYNPATSSEIIYTATTDTIARATTADKVRDVNFHADTTAPSGSTQLNCDGYFYATKVYNAVYNDLAEFMWKADERAKAGDVLIAIQSGVCRSYARAQKTVVGVYSDSYGFALYQDQEDKKIPVGMTGTLKVKLFGEARIGDQLVSYKNGYAIKANLFEKLFKRDALIGKVINNIKDKDERVLILIK